MRSQLDALKTVTQVMRIGLCIKPIATFLSGVAAVFRANHKSGSTGPSFFARGGRARAKVPKLQNNEHHRFVRPA